MKILVVDHEKVQRANLASKLVAHGHQLDAVADGQHALDLLNRDHYDLVFADPNVPTVSGIQLLKQIKSGPQRSIQVVMMSGDGSIPLAVEAVKYGAHDFLKKPIPAEKLLKLLHEIEQRLPGGSRGGGVASDELAAQIIGQSEAIQRVKRMVRIAARADANVLIHGETGVGKDLIASVIHTQSHRRAHPFMKVGCAVLAPALIESELYGHEEGAFTGADQPRLGRFELAEGGTIYLDDVDDIPLAQQAKLLRVIEEKVFERVGSNAPVRANVRIVASTKLSLLDKVGDGSFRQDLYYRLDVLRVRVPTLRSRREDIPALTAHLLDRIAGQAPFEIEDAAVEVLMQHDWPGNVRELHHALERAWLIGEGRVTARLLEADLGPAAARPPASGSGSKAPAGFRAAMDFAERQLLSSALETSGGNKTAAAHALGMKPSTFRDKLAKHGLS